MTVTTDPWLAAAIERVDALLAAEVAKGYTPGIAAAITDGDQLLYVATAGLAERASGTPVRPDHRFEIGSIGKTFTAFALMQLVDEGRLDPADPVTRHLPWFRVPGDTPITLEHLLTHRSGITAGIDGTPEAFGQVWALRDLVPGAAPGSRFHYSNVGYKVLGLVLEAVERRPYPEVIGRRILEPLGMADSSPAITNDGRSRLAVGHTWAADDRIGHPGIPLVAATWLETDTADGSIAATAGDMAAFARLLLRRGAGIVSEATWARMSEPQAMDDGFGYGYAIGTRETGGRTFLGHNGGMVGYVSSLSVEPASGLGAVVLMNGPGEPVLLCRALIGAVRDARDGVATAATEIAAAGDAPGDAGPDEAPGGDPPSLAGRWQALDAGEPLVLELEMADGGLHVREGDERAALDAWDDDLLQIPHPAWDRFLLRVDRGEDGEPELWHGGRRFVRAGATPRTLAEPDPRLRAHIGTYRCFSPWNPLFHVVLRGDRLWLLFPESPDGAEPEQPLVPLADGSFRLGDEDGGPERVRFDLEHEGRSRRAHLSGWPFHRVGD